MATADRGRRRLWLTVIPIAIVTCCGAIGFALADTPGRVSEPIGEAPAPLSVASTARHRFADLAAMLAASDLVVRGRVIASEPGRVYGTGNTTGDTAGSPTGIRSHVLTLRVDSVLAGGSESGASGTGAPSAPKLTVLLEEEDSLADGTPLVVDGMRAGRVGDDGVWFLVASHDPEFPGFAVVNAQGRYLETPQGRLRGGDRSDALVRALEGLGSKRLASSITAGGATAS